VERAPGASAASEGSAPSVLDGVPEVSGMLPRVLRVGWMTSWCRWWPRRAHRGSIRDSSCTRPPAARGPGAGLGAVGQMGWSHMTPL
jgi:hypothetical protein